MAAGIKHKYSEEQRMAAGMCAVLKLEKYYPTLRDFLDKSGNAPNATPTSLDDLGRDFGILGKCMMQNGI